jgi:hypothetical protein
MLAPLYHPFERFNFSNRNCFLTGQPLNSEEEKIQVFPAWLMARHQLEDKAFKLLDESYTSYKDLKIPCAAEVNNQYLEPLENEVASAFEQGYEAVSRLDELKLFQWAGKLLYGIIFNEMQAGIRQQHALGEGFHLSQALKHKFSHLHLMLQTLNIPIQFDGFKPYSVVLYKVNNAENEFGYRDEINTLTFSIRVKDFGLIICLQDNGANRFYHRELLQQLEGQTLHPIQFEEVSARFFYSAYLFNRLPEYEVLHLPDVIDIEALPLRGHQQKPPFDDWQEKTYGQVLESFWKKWGFILFEIIKNPDRPMSFLFDAEDNLVEGKDVELPL